MQAARNLDASATRGRTMALLSLLTGTFFVLFGGATLGLLVIIAIDARTLTEQSVNEQDMR